MIEALNGWGRMWAEFSLAVIVQNTLFLGLIFVFLRRLRNAPARVKHAIAAVGLVKLLLPPFIPAHLLAPASGETGSLPVTTLLFSFSPLPVGVTDVDAAPLGGLDLFGIVLAVWVVVVLFLLARSVLSTVRLTASVKNAVLVTAGHGLEIASGRRIRVYKSDRISMPLIIAILPRRIFVPVSWDCWSPQCRRAVIGHEVAHIERHDGLFQALGIVAQALYFFHPLVLILNQRLREYREMACDDASVGRDRHSRLGYSRFLVEMAETALYPPVTCESASALMRRKNELLKRVVYQMKESNILQLSRKKTGILLGVLVLTLFPFSLYMGGTERTAAAGTNTPAAKASPGRVDVDVSIKGDEVYINGGKTQLEGFSQAVSTAANGASRVVVNIECNENVSMSSLFEVQKRLLDLGLLNVTYADRSGALLPMTLPGQDIKQKFRQISPDKIVVLVIDSSGKILVDEKKAGVLSAGRYIKQRLSDNPNLIVSIHLSGKTRYDDFVSVLGEVKKAGATRVFINDPGI